MVQQLTGINILVVYISSIFDFNQTLKTYISLIVNSLQLVACLLVAGLASRLGRKQILIGGVAVIVACNVLMGIGFITADKDNKSVDLSVVLRVVGSLIFFFAFGMSAGPIVWQYIPQVVEGNIVGAATLLNWFLTFLIVAFFPSLKSLLGGEGFIFMGLAVISALLLVYEYFCMRETKDRTFAQIVQDYME